MTFFECEQQYKKIIFCNFAVNYQINKMSNRMQNCLHHYYYTNELVQFNKIINRQNSISTLGTQPSEMLAQNEYQHKRTIKIQSNSKELGKLKPNSLFVIQEKR